MPRPEVNFSWQTLDAVLQYGANLTDCAEFCNCSEDTVQRRIKEHFQMTFHEYRKRKMAKLKMSIVKKQVDKALEGDNTMLIWVGKNLCEQSDKFSAEVTNTENNKITFAYSIPGNRFAPQEKEKAIDAESSVVDASNEGGSSGQEG